MLGPFATAGWAHENSSYLLDRAGQSPDELATALRERWRREGLTLEGTQVRGRLGIWPSSVEDTWRRDGAAVSVVLQGRGGDDQPEHPRVIAIGERSATPVAQRPDQRGRAALARFPLPPEVASASAPFDSKPDEIGYLLSGPNLSGVSLQTWLLRAMEREGYEVVWASFTGPPAYRWHRPGEARLFQAQVFIFGPQVQFYVNDFAVTAPPRAVIAGTAARWGDLPLPPWSVQDTGLTTGSHGYFLVVAPGATAQEVRAWLVYSWQARGLRLTRTVAPSGAYPGFMTFEAATGGGRFDVAVWPGTGLMLLDITRR